MRYTQKSASPFNAMFSVSFIVQAYRPACIIIINMSKAHR